MKNNILIVVLVVIIGVLSGISLLLGIGNAVSVAVGPMIAEMGSISSTQRSSPRKRISIRSIPYPSVILLY